jgi:hypothetical protein
MRLLMMAVTFAAFAAPATCQPMPTTNDLAFLTGCWKFESRGRVVEEHWMAPAGGALMGVSRTVVNGKVAEFEFLQIRDLPEGLTYIAKPSGQAEAKFVLKTHGGDEVVFENTAHDFPQRIRYRIAGDSLRARVEGVMNGKDRAFEFPYQRSNCTS